MKKEKNNQENRKRK